MTGLLPEEEANLSGFVRDGVAYFRCAICGGFHVLLPDPDLDVEDHGPGCDGELNCTCLDLVDVGAYHDDDGLDLADDPADWSHEDWARRFLR